MASYVSEEAAGRAGSASTTWASWTMTGTTTDGTCLDHHGCDLWTFRDGLVTKKNSFWKIRTAE